MALTAMTTDTKTFHYGEAMKQPNKGMFILSMIKEVEDLTKAEVWEVIKQDSVSKDKNIIKAIWSFKWKKLPDGTYLKHKARLCGHGSMQIEGEHFWDTYSPVVKWMTLHFMMTVLMILNLHTHTQY